MERAVPDFKMPFSEFSSKCQRLKFVFVSVLSPLPISFILFQLHSSGEGAEKMEVCNGRRGSSRQELIQGKVRLGMIRYYLTMSTVEQHWIRLSRKAGKSPCWESTASRVPVSIRLHQAVFLLPFFLVLSCKMGSFIGLSSSYQLSF